MDLIKLVIELSLREISFVVYVHALIDAKIVRSRDGQCITEESP